MLVSHRACPCRSHRRVCCPRPSRRSCWHCCEKGEVQAERKVAERVDYEREKDKKEAEREAASMARTPQREWREVESGEAVEEARGDAPDFRRIMSEGVAEIMAGAWRGLEEAMEMPVAVSDDAEVSGGGGGSPPPAISDGLAEGAKGAIPPVARTALPPGKT